MSKSRSASLEIVPPATSRVRENPAVPPASHKHNRKPVEEDPDDADADAEGDELDNQPPPAPAPKPAAAAAAATTTNIPNAPKPCDRCARTGKPCKGVAGSRCEYCKRLKQKCSNSSGPPRKSATTAPKPAPAPKRPAETAGAKAPAGKGAAPSQLPSKRKAPASAPQNGAVDNHDLDGEGSTVEEEHDSGTRHNKKRRVAKGPTRLQLVKAVNDIEASMKRVQASVAKEVEKMSGIVKILNAKIEEMDDE
ncbi:hypothetical protein JR316_0004697 [Psilocybe cubensis]|uniref:Uncharacterized protein n=2 Tax=Psilocybe cubensis TaxID=181762 RepID=A0ACB8H4N5_PSICU|nr:hypothetical protein JR316_0004697 [Psilocybe cubensis]KAH9482597.1 hypothetical protein JR316_0004697 [Psilocybe cubensis]